MSDAAMEDRFQHLADSEMDAVREVIPADSTGKVAVLLEVLRALDWVTISNPLVPSDQRLAAHDLQIIQWGWNGIAELLLRPVSQRNAMPFMENSESSSRFALSLLHQAGRASLLKRTADMIRFGLFRAEESADGITVCQNDGNMVRQFSDLLEPDRLKGLERVLDDPATENSHGWELVNHEDAEWLRRQGAFMGRRREDPLATWKSNDVNSLMEPLTFPWPNPNGVMMGYKAHPDVDDHFFAEGMNFIDSCRHDAGLHPSCDFDGTSAADVLTISAILAGLHMKHVRFALLAQKTHENIEFRKSLTIWGPKSELVESISEYAAVEPGRVEQALSAVTMRASEASFFRNRTTSTVPLLIDLENGLVLRPVSSICRNPLTSVLRLQQHRSINGGQGIIEPRENWLRTDLYSMFRGSRYMTVDGNVKLKNGNQVTTDVDAAILDRTSGDLALFQLKWQDFATNDIRALHSKAKNFVREVDEWASRVSKWISSKSVIDVQNTFRIKPSKDGCVRRIFMFVLSRHACRMVGYGVDSTNGLLALATWPQWVRVRTELGPVPQVFDRIHERLCLEHEREATVSLHPFRLDVTSETISVQYEDLFVDFDDSKDL